MIRLTIDMTLDELDKLDADEETKRRVEALVDELRAAGVDATWTVERLP